MRNLHRCHCIKTCLTSIGWKGSTKKEENAAKKRHVAGTIKGVGSYCCYPLFFFSEQNELEILEGSGKHHRNKMRPTKSWGGENLRGTYKWVQVQQYLSDYGIGWRNTVKRRHSQWLRTPQIARPDFRKLEKSKFQSLPIRKSNSKLWHNH